MKGVIDNLKRTFEEENLNLDDGHNIRDFNLIEVLVLLL